jgi:hypothetical protein
VIDAYLEVLELGYYEAKEAFVGLADEHVWTRPADGLLSIGELAGHVAYWEAVKFAGDAGGSGRDPATSPMIGHRFADLARCRITSPLIDHRFSYLPETLANPPSPEHLAMTAEQVCSELLRVHKEAIAYFRSLNLTAESPLPGWPASDKCGEFLKYAAFHVSYHTGQIYTARHLLGEQTPDN